MKNFWVDGHSDLLSYALKEGVAIERNDSQIDLERARALGPGLQVLALFPGDEGKDRYAQVNEMLDALEKALAGAAVEYPFAKTGADVARLRAEGRFGFMVSLEGADALAGDLSRMDALYARGVRLLGLTWNWENALCGAIGFEGEPEGTPHGGVTELGREGVAKWEALGGIIDVSHASEAGFWDALEACGKPVIASHSNCLSLCGHRRNLSDLQINGLARKGGVMGMNYCPAFLVDGGEGAALADVARHAAYAVKVGGEDVVGLGSDFDGIGRPPAGLESVADVARLEDALSAEGLSERVIEKIMGGNFLRVLEAHVR